MLQYGTLPAIFKKINSGAIQINGLRRHFLHFRTSDPVRTPTHSSSPPVVVGLAAVNRPAFSIPYRIALHTMPTTLDRNHFHQKFFHLDSFLNPI